MSEQKEQRTTAADIKKQIEEAKAAQKVKDDVKASGLPLTGGLANGINASESTPAQVPDKSQPVPPATTGVEASKPSNDGDLNDWAKKKGIDWTTEESVLSALRKSDQAFHAKRVAEKQKEEAQQRQTYQPPAYQPAYTPPPAYAPSPLPNPAAIQNIAREYNMTPEDAERLLKFNRDFFEVASRGERERMQREVEAIKKDTEKNNVFRELSSDPVFRRPDVGQEYVRVIEEMQERDPQSFETPSMYRRAFEMAVYNIGRRNLEGRTLTEGVSPVPGVQLPSTPPRSLGNGSGGGASENESGIDTQAFAKASLEEKRAILEKAGLRPAY